MPPPKPDSQTHADHFDPPVTAESIAAAKLAQLRERAEVTRLTGVRFTADGKLRVCDELEVAMLIRNAICAAVYGPSGEWRN